MVRLLSIIFFLALPVVYFPFLFNASELPKVVIFRILIELLVGFLGLGLIGGLVAFFRKGKLKKSVTFWLLTYLVWTLLASFGGGFFARSFLGNYFRHQGFLTLFHLVVFSFLVSLFQNKLGQKELSFSVAMGSFLAAVFAIYSVFPSLSRGEFFPETAGTLANPNFLGGYLLITLPFTFYLASKRRFFALLLPFSWLGIVFSGSRAAIFLLLILLGFYLVRQLGKKALIAFLVFSGLLAGFFLLKEKSPSAYENRSFAWRKGFRAFSQRPFLGWGLENFDSAFESVLEKDEGAVLKDIRVDKAHNEFLEVLVASGIVGLTFYLIIVFMALKNLWLKVESSQEKDWWLTVLLSLILWLLRAQVNPISIAELVFFWFLIGMANADKLSLSPLFGQKEKSLEKALVITLWLSMIFLIVFNLRYLRADYYYKKGLVLERTDRIQAVNLFKKANQIYPWGEVYQLRARGL